MHNLTNTLRDRSMTVWQIKSVYIYTFMKTMIQKHADIWKKQTYNIILDNNNNYESIKMYHKIYK